MIAEFARYLHGVRYADLSAAAQSRLRLSLLANLAVAIAGPSNTRMPRPARVASGHVLFDGGFAASAREAAFWNGAAMHARTQDDFHPLGNLHIGTVVIPAALAMAEARGSSGAALLDAVAAGYAAGTGLSRSISAHTTPRGLRSTCLYSPFGATTAAAKLAGFDAAQLGNALALTAQMVGGTTQCWVDGSDEWQLHVARGAETGLVAVDLTKAGVRGGAHQLDGPAGFLPAVTGQRPTTDQILADAEASRAIEETVLKRYPVSGICQPIVLLAERLAPQLAVPADRIARLRVYMRPFEMNYPGTLNRGPFRSFSDVLMSAAFCATSVLAHGSFSFDDLLRLDNPPRDRLIARTEVLPDPALGTLSARLEATLDDGRTLVERVDNGGAALSLDWTTIDAWAADLWRDGGRDPSRYAAFRGAIDRLADTPAAALVAAIVR